jgi:hypothetical protein
MTAQSPSPKYLVYTLRCWEERRGNTDAPGEWRFTLLDLQTGKRHGFGMLRQLAVFLEERLEKEMEGAAL